MEMGVIDHKDRIPPVLSILSTLLQLAADRNEAAVLASKEKQQLTPIAAAFSCRAMLPISVHNQLKRIYLSIDFSPSCYVLAYIYIQRFLHQNRAFAIYSFNVNNLLLTAVLTAVKFWDKRNLNNGHFAKVGGIALAEMNNLEFRFLFGLNFDLFITPMTFSAYCSDLQTEMSLLRPPVIPRPLQRFLSEDEEFSRGRIIIRGGGNSSLSQQNHLMAEMSHLLFDLRRLNV